MALAAVLAVSAVTGWAQAKECNDDFKTATYSKWYDNRKDNQDEAYAAAKEYVAVCPADDSPYATALKKFIADYDKVHSNQKLAADFDAAVKANRYADTMRLGKQLVALPSHAENAVIYILMAGAGLLDANLLADSATAAKKAIELIEGGKQVTPAYQTKDQALAAMNYVLAKATMKTSPTDAIPYLVKALRFESELKKDPRAYNELATAYGEGPVAKYAKDYQALVEAQKSVDSPEAKLVMANLNQALDRQIDAFARAASASTAQADKDAFKKVLADVYKDRNKKDPAPAELESMVASALSKPVPDAPTPITTLPTQTTGTTPPGTGAMPAATNPGGSAMPGTNGGNGAGSSSSSNAGKPATNGAGSATAPSKPAATPKPKPRRANHRRR